MFSSCVPLVWLWSVTRLGKAKKRLVIIAPSTPVQIPEILWNTYHLPIFSQTGAGLFPSLAWSKQVVLFQFVVRSLLPTAQEYAHARQLVLQVWGAVDLTWQPVTVGSQKQSFKRNPCSHRSFFCCEIWGGISQIMAYGWLFHDP